MRLDPGQDGLGLESPCSGESMRLNHEGVGSPEVQVSGWSSETPHRKREQVIHVHHAVTHYLHTARVLLTTPLGNDVTASKARLIGPRWVGHDGGVGRGEAFPGHAALPRR